MRTDSEALRAAIAQSPGGRSLLGGTGSIIVAEVAQSHDGSLGLAHAFIDAIAAAGADAVKFQTHLAAAESTRREPWRVQFSPQDTTRYDYWRRMEFTEPQWAALKRHAEERGLLFLSSPFSIDAVDLLARLGVAAWKVPSGEVSNIPLLDAIGRHGAPVLLSSGMSEVSELDDAVAHIAATGNPYAVLQCTTAYPCPPDRVGLNILSFFRQRYSCAVGLSDHSGTPYPSLAAAVLGADVLEVHVTLSREMFGPDVSASLTTAELREMVKGVRFIETMMTNPVDKNALGVDLQPLRQLFTKSVVARIDLACGYSARPGASDGKEARHRHSRSPAATPVRRTAATCPARGRLRARDPIWTQFCEAERSASSSPRARATAASRRRCTRSGPIPTSSCSSSSPHPRSLDRYGNASRIIEEDGFEIVGTRVQRAGRRESDGDGEDDRSGAAGARDGLRESQAGDRRHRGRPLRDAVDRGGRRLHEHPGRPCSGRRGYRARSTKRCDTRSQSWRTCTWSPPTAPPNVSSRWARTRRQSI